MGEPYVSQIKQFGCYYAPWEWASCDGQIMQVGENTALFSLLGTGFGGDGRTTFGLPDLRGRMPIGTGQGPGLSNRMIGQYGGSEYSYLNNYTLPAHNHEAAIHASSTGGPLQGTPNTNTVVSCNSNNSGETGASLRVWGSNSDAEIYADEIGSENNTMHAGLVNVTVDMSPVSPTINTTIDSVNIDSAGGGHTHENMLPYLVMNCCISLQGTFPSRN
ncbi:MAG: phage tail protein [bacterium]|nr:phage tail protein [bacterium]